MFGDHVYRFGRQPRGDRYPGPALVVGTPQIRGEVILSIAVLRHVNGIRSVRRGENAGHPSVTRKATRGVAPSSAIVRRPDFALIRARIKCAECVRALSDRR